MIAHLEATGLGVRKINYKLRDWLFSRQRYWGEPFPILHEVGPAGKPTGLMRAIPEAELPVRLPDVEDYKPTGSPEGPLGQVTHCLTLTRDGHAYPPQPHPMPQSPHSH